MNGQTCTKKSMVSNILKWREYRVYTINFSGIYVRVKQYMYNSISMRAHEREVHTFASNASQASHWSTQHEAGTGWLL